VSADVLFRDLLAHWPLCIIIYTMGEGERHHRTHVHRSPKDPDVFALVRIHHQQLAGISYITRTELAALASM
jgi:hypothetical protein